MTAARTESPVGGGLRLAVSLLTVIPVRAGRVDRETARWAMTLAGGDVRFPTLVPAVAGLEMEVGSAAKRLREGSADASETALADALEACATRLRALPLTRPLPAA